MDLHYNFLQQNMRNLLIVFLSWIVLLLGSSALAQDVLPAHEVFIPSISAVDDKHITIDIDIKKGYYLYRQQRFSVSADGDAIDIGDIQLSAGAEKTDAFSGTQSVWYGGTHRASIAIAYENPNRQHSATLTLKYQGCQEGVICYPPQTTSLEVALPESQPSTVTEKTFLQTSSPAKWSPVSQTASEGIVFGKPQKAPLLSEKEAFPFSAEVTADNALTAQWLVADGYYLYRDRIRVLDDDVETIVFSDSDIHADDFFGDQRVYRHDEGVIKLLFAHSVDNKTFDIQFQGCADQGICYPMMQRRIVVEGGRVQSIEAVVPESKQRANETAVGETVVDGSSEQRGGSWWIEWVALILQQNIWLGFGLLLMAGIALSFTPCVLPMVPILLGIITNQRNVTRPKAALLSSAYALGIATMMAFFGLLVAKTGVNIQIVFQQPLWLMLFASIFVLMGLAMLGVFSVAVPSKVQNKVYAWQSRFQSAKPINVFIVGALSTLVVGPCVAPPLIAILTFISMTHDSFLGALYLFALGLGMGLPLVVFATISTSIPKTGAFSHLITRLFAMLMFGVGLLLVSRLLPDALSLSLWGVFMLVVAWILWKSDFVSDYAQQAVRFLAVLSLAIGVAWFGGGVTGHGNPLKPFQTVVRLPFQYIHSQAELQSALAASDKPVMLDVYANWCTSCKEIEHTTFTDTAVVAALGDFTLLKLDLSKLTQEKRAILTEFGLIAPPVLLFFNEGREIRSERVVGVIGAKNMLETLSRAARTPNSK